MALERAYLAGVDMDMGDYDRRWEVCGVLVAVVGEGGGSVKHIAISS